MRLAKYLLPTLKEIPKEAEIPSHKLMLRAGLIRKLASGIYEFLPLGLKVLRKVENIVREEMDRIGGQELALPALQPKELWSQTGRWGLYGKELLRLKDRHEREFCLGPTHEEIITYLVSREVRSYRQLPLLLYQFQAKFRDEIRPRFGVMRAREFYMKDAYSFDADEEQAQKSYQKAFESYGRICERCGLSWVAVEAETGFIGGTASHEFMALAETGEEEICTCECGYAANVNIAECPKSKVQSPMSKVKELEEVRTPGMKTVEEVGKFLGEAPDKFIKTLLFLADGKPIIVLIRGDCQINETKLTKALQCQQLLLADAQTIEKITGAPVGFAGPVNLPPITDYRLPITVLADYSVETIINGISGANKKDYHLKNININRDYTPDKIVDIRKIQRGNLCPKCGQELKFQRGIEVGHTFMLGEKYSKSLQATFLDKDGNENFFVMGCYGVGVSRLIAAIIEQHHDKDGISWPVSVAPYQILILPVDYSDGKIKSLSDKLYGDLSAGGWEVLIDDREDSAGIKFKDADLMGVPLTIVIGKSYLKTGKVEIKLRKDHKTISTDPREVPSSLPQLLSKTK